MPYLLNLNTRTIHDSQSQDGRCKLKSIRVEHLQRFSTIQDALAYLPQGKKPTKLCSFCLSDTLIVEKKRRRIMRNHVALLLCALSLSLMLTGCNSSQVNSLSTNASVSSTPAGQPVTPSPTPSPAPSPTLEPSNWEIKSSVDKFGDDTGDVCSK